MATEPKNKAYDGWLQLTACNGSERPLSIPRNQVHRAVNCSFREDEPGPRPGFLFRQLTFRDDVDKNLFDTGRWQGALVYKPPKQPAFHLVAKGGRLWKVDVPNNYTVSDVTITIPLSVAVASFNAPVIGNAVTVNLNTVTGLAVGMVVRVEGAAYEVQSIDATLNQASLVNLNDVPTTTHAIGAPVIAYDLNESTYFKNWMLQAEKWAIVQDGFNRAIIFDGSFSRRAGSLEIPIGTAMAYGLGRIWVANSAQNGFAASDLIYGPSGTPGERYKDSILKFTENSWLAGGNWFSVPEESGLITGMKFIANLDVVLGQGPLQVFTENGSFSVRVPANRLEWNLFGYDETGALGPTAIDPIQTVSLKEEGATSDTSIVTINSDFFFRARSGVRTFQLFRRQFGTWANTPISQPVDWAIKTDPQPLLQYASAVLFDRRFICTCAPQVEDRGVVHKGLISMDFELSNWAENRPPDWDGLWTISFAYQIIAGNHDGNDRCFYYTRNQDGEVELFEVDPFAHQDQSAATMPTLIRWAYETNEIAFQTEQSAGLFDLKRLWGAEVRVSNMEGEVEFRMRWKPDRHPCWFKWAFWEECAPTGADCEYINRGECRDWTTAKPQNRSAMGIPQPPDVCVNVDGIQARNFYTIQIRLDVRGYCKVNAIRLIAEPIDQPVVAKKVECITDGWL